jgi:hypothetical protein
VLKRVMTRVPGIQSLGADESCSKQRRGRNRNRRSLSSLFQPVDGALSHSIRPRVSPTKAPQCFSIQITSRDRSRAPPHKSNQVHSTGPLPTWNATM